MRRGRSPGREDRKRSEKAIIEALDEGPGTFTEIHERVDMAKSTFNNSLKGLEDKGEVERYYDRDRRIVLIRLSEKMIVPIERTLRHLDNLTIRSLLDVEKGRELLNENVVESIMDISSLRYEPGIKKNFTTGKERLERLPEDSAWPFSPPIPVFNEYHLVRAIARYEFETRTSKLYVEVSPVLFDLGQSPPILASIEDRVELQKALRGERDNPRFYPATGIVNERNVKEEFEELRLWIRPLLESARETQLRREGEAQLRKEAEEGGMEKALEKWLDEINLDRDKLLGGLFGGEQETYLRRELIPAWINYISELHSEKEEKNRGH